MWVSNVRESLIFDMQYIFRFSRRNNSFYSHWGGLENEYLLFTYKDFN